MTKDAASQACLISLTSVSLKEGREDSGIARCGEDGAAQRSRLLSVRHRHDSSQIGQLLARAKENKTAFTGGSSNSTTFCSPSSRHSANHRPMLADMCM